MLSSTLTFKNNAGKIPEDILVLGNYFRCVRGEGLLPFVIVWLTNPSLSIVEVFASAFSSDNAMVAESLEASKPLLLLGGGSYLFLVFLAWLFLEEKKCVFLVERFIHRQGVWFYAIASIFTTLIVYFSVQINRCWLWPQPSEFRLSLSLTALRRMPKRKRRN
jgi:hypothetical protein